MHSKIANGLSKLALGEHMKKGIQAAGMGMDSYINHLSSKPTGELLRNAPSHLSSMASITSNPIKQGLKSTYMDSATGALNKKRVARDAGIYAVGATAISDGVAAVQGRRDLTTKDGERNLPIIPFI